MTAANDARFRPGTGMICRTRSGHRTYPLRLCINRGMAWTAHVEGGFGTSSWTAGGLWRQNGQPSPMDLVAEWEPAEEQRMAA